MGIVGMVDQKTMTASGKYWMVREKHCLVKPAMWLQKTIPSLNTLNLLAQYVQQGEDKLDFPVGINHYNTVFVYFAVLSTEKLCALADVSC